MTTDYDITAKAKPDYVSEDVTHEFSVTPCEMLAAWARQDSSVASELLLETVLNRDCVPTEGTPGLALGFRTRDDGLGYTMTYSTSDEDEGGYVEVRDVRVWRDGRWDDEGVKARSDRDLLRRVAELERENAQLREVARLQAETLRKPEPVGLLDGGVEVSERLMDRIDGFERGLRRACHLAYSLQHELADEGHVRYAADGTALWAYGSKRMKNVSDELAGIVEHYFGGFSYPVD